MPENGCAKCDAGWGEEEVWAGEKGACSYSTNYTIATQTAASSLDRRVN